MRGSRRQFLAGLGTLAVGAGVVHGSDAFSTIDADRGANVSTADGGNAFLGIVGQGPVKKNDREPMVDLTNNLDDALSITVSLSNCSDGTLFDNEGYSGCTVAIQLQPGNTRRIDIKASVTGDIPYSISASGPDFALDTTETVTSEAGNTKGAVRIQKPVKDKDFTADTNGNDFDVDKVDIRDEDGDNDLDKIEFRVKEGGTGGTIVGSKDVTNPPGDRYNPKGNPAVEIEPDSGYTLKSNTTYQLEVTAYDVDGNFASETVEDTT